MGGYKKFKVILVIGGIRIRWSQKKKRWSIIESKFSGISISLKVMLKLFQKKEKVMLTSVLRVMVNNSILESFDTTFMGNEKDCQNIKIIFFIKTFFKWIVN